MRVLLQTTNLANMANTTATGMANWIESALLMERAALMKAKSALQDERIALLKERIAILEERQQEPCCKLISFFSLSKC